VPDPGGVANARKLPEHCTLLLDDVAYRLRVIRQRTDSIGLVQYTCGKQAIGAVQIDRDASIL
jgi:hypothetical protein